MDFKQLIAAKGFDMKRSTASMIFLAILICAITGAAIAWSVLYKSRVVRDDAIYSDQEKEIRNELENRNLPINRREN